MRFKPRRVFQKVTDMETVCGVPARIGRNFGSRFKQKQIQESASRFVANATRDLFREHYRNVRECIA